MDTLALKYQGFFNDSITSRITALMESALTENQLDQKTRNQVKAIIIEQVQNVARYSSLTSRGTVEVGQEGDVFFVKTVSPVKPNSKDILDARLSYLAEADKSTLQKRFQEAMRDPFGNDSMGVGLGLLFLAKQSKPNLAYEFVPGDGPEYLFQLKSNITVDRGR